MSTAPDERAVRRETRPPAESDPPKRWVAWLAVVVAVAGWYVSFKLALISSGGAADSLLAAVCGGSDAAGKTGCDAVLTAPQAYFALGTDPGAPRMPVSVLGMAYFAAVGVWYLFVGPPTRARRGWHLVIAVFVLMGVWESVGYMRIMAFELERWCGGCLVAHALNGGLAVLTILAWPWRRADETGGLHPSHRLALATATAGGLALLTHLALVYVLVAGQILQERTAAFRQVLDDPAFILWDFERQDTVELPLRADEFLAGDPAAPHTIMVFSDFQCTVCKQLHETLQRVLTKYAGRVRVAYRHYPQDPECNPHPNFRAGAHGSACRAARAAEAVRRVAGDEAYARMCALLYERRSQLPKRPVEQLSPTERNLLTNWAVELGVDRAAFEAAFNSDQVAVRIVADIAQADALGLAAMPVLYLDGKRLRNWTRDETWDALLAAPRGNP